jgi:toxin-antitoxin system PIN domain toxin
MVLLDVNVLVRAFRKDAPHHSEIKAWLDSIVSSDSTFGLSDLALSGFLRIVTHPRIFDPPAPVGTALDFAEAIRSQPNCLSISPGKRHWSVFTRLCRESDARGNLIPDAYFAALAIESGSEWITTDRDFSRFEGLKWRHPLK